MYVLLLVASILRFDSFTKARSENVPGLRKTRPGVMKVKFQATVQILVEPAMMIVLIQGKAGNWKMGKKRENVSGWLRSLK